MMSNYAYTLEMMILFPCNSGGHIMSGLKVIKRGHRTPFQSQETNTINSKFSVFLFLRLF